MGTRKKNTAGRQDILPEQPVDKDEESQVSSKRERNPITTSQEVEKLGIVQLRLFCKAPVMCGTSDT